MVGTHSWPRQRVRDAVVMPHTIPTSCLPSGSVGGSALANLIDRSVVSTRPKADSVSALDHAYEGLLVVTKLAVLAKPDWTSHHGLMLCSNAVAVAEDYFRSILVEVAQICPKSLERVGAFETRVEFIAKGSMSDALRSVLEATSFSSKENVREWTKKITGMSLPGKSAPSRLLDDFDKVCQIRHCATHAGGYIAAGNARVLQVGAGKWISIADPEAIHEVVAVVTSTIRSYNQTLFEDVVGGWIDDGVLQGDWDRDRERFTAIWDAFRSDADRLSMGTSTRYEPIRARAYDAYRVVRPSVQRRLNSS